MSALSENSPVSNALETSTQAMFTVSQTTLNSRAVEFHAQVLDHVDQWHNAVTTRVNNGTKTTDALRREVDHYGYKLDSLQASVAKIQEQGKPIPAATTEKVERNQQKLQQANDSYRAAAHEHYWLLDEVVNRSWRELHPVLLHLLEFDLNVNQDNFDNGIVSNYESTIATLQRQLQQQQVNPKRSHSGRLASLATDAPEQLSAQSGGSRHTSTTTKGPGRPTPQSSHKASAETNNNNSHGELQVQPVTKPVASRSERRGRTPGRSQPRLQPVTKPVASRSERRGTTPARSQSRRSESRGSTPARSQSRHRHQNNYNTTDSSDNRSSPNKKSKQVWPPPKTGAQPYSVERPAEAPSSLSSAHMGTSTNPTTGLLPHTRAPEDQGSHSNRRNPLNPWRKPAGNAALTTNNNGNNNGNNNNKFLKTPNMSGAQPVRSPGRTFGGGNNNNGQKAPGGGSPIGVRPPRATGKGAKVASSAHPQVQESRSPWEGADPSRWKFTEQRFGGSFVFETKGKTENVIEPIQLGIEKLRKDPDTYMYLFYQSNMTDWPQNQQRYTLIYREGAKGHKPTGINPRGPMTVLTQYYERLPPFPNDELPAQFRDGHTDRMTHQRRQLHSAKKQTNHAGSGYGCW